MKTYYEMYVNREPDKEYDYAKGNEIIAAQVNGFAFTRDGKPLLGAFNLKTNFGLIIADSHGNFAILNILNSYQDLIKDVLKGMQNKNEYKVLIVPGIYTTVKKIEEITNYLKNELYFAGYDFDVEVKNLEHYLNRRNYSIEFAYDTRSKEFLKPNYGKMVMKGRK